MTLAVTTADSFATGLISNINLGSRMNKSFATGFKGQLIQISEKERIGIDRRENEAKKILMAQGIEAGPDGQAIGFPKTKLDFERDNEGNLLLQNGLPIKKAITSWYDIRHMIARNTFIQAEKELVNESGLPIIDPATGKPKTELIFDENNNPVMVRKVKVDQKLLEKTLEATKNLKTLDIDSISPPKYAPGTTAIEAFEEELMKNTKGIITKKLKEFDLTLSSFPQGTSSYEALKMVESKDKQGLLDPNKVEELKRNMAVLRAEELFSIKRFKPFGGNTPSSAVKLLEEQPEKFRPTPVEPKFKPIWKNPPQMRVDLGKITYSQWKSAVVANAKSVNPSYTEEEIIKKFGFDRIVSLGAGWFGRTS